MRKYLIRLAGFLVLAGIIGFGLWLFGYYVWGLSIAVRSPGWPTTAGKVTASDVCESYGKSGTRYYPCLMYRYSVNGTVFESDQITGVHQDPGSLADAEGTALKYAAGSRVKVFYDPSSPGTACLEPGVIPWTTYLKIGLGLFFALAGLILFWLVLLEMRAPGKRDLSALSRDTRES